MFFLQFMAKSPDDPLAGLNCRDEGPEDKVAHSVRLDALLFLGRQSLAVRPDGCPGTSPHHAGFSTFPPSLLLG